MRGFIKYVAVRVSMIISTICLLILLVCISSPQEFEWYISLTKIQQFIVILLLITGAGVMGMIADIISKKFNILK